MFCYLRHFSRHTGEELLRDWNEVERMSQRKKINSLSLPGRLVGDYKTAVSYEPSRMFEPVSYREVAAEAMREHMLERDFSEDPDVRNMAHFEGGLSPEEYHKVITRAIPEEDIAHMKQIGYRILEFGQYNWDEVLNALKIYFGHFQNVDIPKDYVITYETIQEGVVGFEDKHEGMQVGEISKAMFHFSISPIYFGAVILAIFDFCIDFGYFNDRFSNFFHSSLSAGRIRSRYTHWRY